MMLTAVLLTLGQANVKLTLLETSAIIEQDKAKITVLLQARPTAPVSKVTFRKDNAFVVWDKRGLSIRQGKRVYTSKLAEMSLTPKLFERDEILATKEKMASGLRSREVSGLSGAKRVGSVIYLLPRWAERDGKAWLECLVKVDLAKTAAKPELVGKFDGLSLAANPIEDRLLNVSGNLGVITRNAQTWGLARYDLGKDEFRYDELGTGLKGYEVPRPGRLLVTETTPYDSTTINRVDLSSLTRHLLCDSSGTVTLLDGQEPALALVNRGPSRMLHNLDSGALTGLQADERVIRTEGYALVLRADSARLLSLERLEQVAVAKRTTQPAVQIERTRNRPKPPAPRATRRRP